MLGKLIPGAGNQGGFRQVGSWDAPQLAVLYSSMDDLLGASIRIANWAYSQTDASKGLTWRRADVLVALPPGWRESLEKLWSG